MINSTFFLNNSGLSNTSTNENVPRHRWYIVKEGFSPIIFNKAVEVDRIKPGNIVVDPFSGSGTIALAALENSFDAMAIEVNPFLHFLSSTKLKHAKAKNFKSASDLVKMSIERQTNSPLEGVSTFSERKELQKWLFPTPVLRAFESGKITNNENSPNVRSLIKLALIGAAMDCCNATRDGKCLRYKKNWLAQQATSADFREAFASRVSNITDDLWTEPLNNSNSKVLLGDCRKLILKDNFSQFDICITSPPYLNSFDYSDIYRPEIFLGDFVTNNHELMKIRLKTIRSHIQAKWEYPILNDFGPTFDHSMEELASIQEYLWDKKILKMVQAYFEDMSFVLKGLLQKAKPGASIWLVVSTSAYAGVEIPVDSIIAEIGTRVGWVPREIGLLRRLRSSSQHMRGNGNENFSSVPLRETVVIMDYKGK